MNLKTLVALATLVTGTAFAVVTTDNTLCRIEIDSDTPTTIISVPLVGIGGNAVNLTDLVLTDNLEGAVLLRYNGVNWDSWKVVDNQWTSVQVSQNFVTTQAGEAGRAALARGEAFLITRVDTTKEFYLYGQFDPASVAAKTITAKTWTLLGNPHPEVLDLNKEGLWSGCTEGDQIKVPAATGLKELVYTYKDGKWQTVILSKVDEKLTATWSDDAKIPAGQAFMYISKGNTNPQINW